MPVQTTCPSCRAAAQVPEALFGQRVQCPTCQAIFTAEVDVAPTVHAAQPPPSTPRPHLRYDNHSPTDVQPHRGGTVLTLGILSLIFHCVPLGLIAWGMGHSDLKAMRGREMDRAGEGTTRAGMICGIISSVMFVIGVAAAVVGFVAKLAYAALVW
jgi:hypothetical protein